MKLKLFLIAILQFVYAEFIYSQESLIINVINRSTFSLNGKWNYIVDPYENGYYNYRYQPFENFENPGKGAYFTNAKPENKSDLVEYDFDKSAQINVPGDWNSQKENLFYYEGTVWYKKSFDYQKQNSSNRVFVYFGAVNYQADVYLNGKKLGRHIGGFTPFNFEITSQIKDKDNFLIVKVDNKRKKEGVPTLNTDWWNYGGITRDVQIIETPKNFIQDYFIQLDHNNSKVIKGFIKLNGEDISNKEISISLPELGLDTKVATDERGYAEFTITSENISYWSPENPKLYDVSFKTNEDEIHDAIGFRTIKTEGSSILLNNNKIFLRGISIHEENPIRGGRAYSKEDAEQLLTWAKELGCNFVRLAHYPHNENMARLADQMGILVWEEIPVYWTVDWENKETYANAENQLSEVITRDKNRASVIIWSMANETPNSELRLAFLNKLANTARKLDSTRLISAALEVSNFSDNPFIKTINDPFADKVDVLSFNEYIGWYDGLPDKCSKIEWKINQNKPVIISEFGADAKYGFHADSLTRFSEEYQKNVYIETLKMLGKIQQLQGMTPWILVDFRSPRRPLPNIQDGWNRKGLIDSQGNKKEAFYILQKYYNQKK
jgi:beta-glucuronidase